MQSGSGTAKSSIGKPCLKWRSSSDPSRLRRRTRTSRHEIWLNSYLKSCHDAMGEVCKELRVEHPARLESTAGCISWINGACAQLGGIGKRIDNCLKKECRQASQYAGGHVLSCVQHHRPQMSLNFLREGFGRSRLSSDDIDRLAQSLAPLAEKVFESMNWQWPSW